MSKLFTDAELVRELLSEANAGLLTTRQRQAFEGMLGQERLTDKQAKWVRGMAERFGIQTAPAENLFSTMPRAKRAEHQAKVRTLLPWERGEVSRPLKPPGR